MSRSLVINRRRCAHPPEFQLAESDCFGNGESMIILGDQVDNGGDLSPSQLSDRCTLCLNEWMFPC